MEEAEEPSVRVGTPEYYRERSRSMLRLADEAASEEARNSLILLAASWEELAHQLEHPGW